MADRAVRFAAVWALVLVASLLCAAEPCADGAGEACAAVERDVEDASLLMLHKAPAVEFAHEVSGGSGTCAPLVLPDYDVQGCDNVAVGASCKVGCKAPKVGAAISYFCFSGLADQGQPPAAVHAPLCYDPNGSEFPVGATMQLSLSTRPGCVSCPNAWDYCQILEGVSDPSDPRCTAFELDLDNNNRIKKGGQCLDKYGGGKLGLWGCHGGGNQQFYVKPSSDYPGGEELCVGDMCLTKVGLPTTLHTSPPDASVLANALAAAARDDGPAFVREALAVQECRARLESGLPDDFWPWLRSQGPGLRKALLSSFPVHPRQVALFNEIREAVGPAEFEALGMSAFAVALSYSNRGQGIDDMMLVPHTSGEDNNGAYLKGGEAEMKQAMIDGKHCGIQSNECHNYHRCCGEPDTWKFKWPREPTPSVKEWVYWWLNKTATNKDDLWGNPVQEVPWIFAAYLWPSPLAECEWIHDKLIEGQPMEGSWYLYDSSFHTRLCGEGGPYHPDSLPGIAVYGGVCGRMAKLEWRKTSCMGMPATMKGEPGHCAGYKFKPRRFIPMPLNVSEDPAALAGQYTLSNIPGSYVQIDVSIGSDPFPAESTHCLKCPAWGRCEFLPKGSPDCSKFQWKYGGTHLVTSGNQCLDQHGGPSPGLWGCSSGSTHQTLTPNNDGTYTTTTGRGTYQVKVFDAPPDPTQNGCLKCPSGYSTCSLAAEGSEECTKFKYDGQYFKVARGGNQCLDMYGGPKPGLWGCNGGINQKAVQAGDEFTISSGRGSLRYKGHEVQPPVVGPQCLVCTASKSDCTIAAAGSPECTVFDYEEKDEQIRTPMGECLEVKSGPKAGTWPCSGGHHQHVTKQADGSLKMDTNRGVLIYRNPNGNAWPAEETVWSYQGIHEIECRKSNCHFNSLMSLDAKQKYRWDHKEAALALFEAFNDYEKDGMWPTAHDEARLAATIAYALREAGAASDGELEPLVAWALRRNPALYEAWELAATFPAGGPLGDASQPKRSDLDSHTWYQGLAELQLGREGATEAADKFARKHLGAAGGGRWERYPSLHQALVGKLCGSLSDEVLLELGSAAQQCLRFRSLADGQDWTKAEAEMAATDTESHDNTPSTAFESNWEAVARLTSEGVETAQAKALVEKLLNSLTVAYINPRSEVFYAEHGRLLLRGAYAMVLQLAGVLLPQAERTALLARTTAILQQPYDAPERVFAPTPQLAATFFDWLSRHHGVNGTNNAYQSSSVVDPLNGQDPLDEALPEIFSEFVLDRDAEMERGARFWSEDGIPGGFDVGALLRSLLRLHGPGESSPSDPQADGGLSGAADGGGNDGASLLATSMSPSDLLKLCVDDLLAS